MAFEMQQRELERGGDGSDIGEYWTVAKAKLREGWCMQSTLGGEHFIAVGRGGMALS